jgi:hypothetical protein
MKSKWMLMTVVAVGLSAAVGASAQAPAPKTADSTKSSTVKTSAVSAAPTDGEIADAKSKGLVWVNTSTKVYQKEGAFFGKTKKGKFMTEDEASKAAYRAAKEPAAKKTQPDVKK